MHIPQHMLSSAKLLHWSGKGEPNCLLWLAMTAPLLQASRGWMVASIAISGLHTCLLSAVAMERVHRKTGNGFVDVNKDSPSHFVIVIANYDNYIQIEKDALMNSTADKKYVVLIQKHCSLLTICLRRDIAELGGGGEWFGLLTSPHLKTSLQLQHQCQCQCQLGCRADMLQFLHS